VEVTINNETVWLDIQVEYQPYDGLWYRVVCDHQGVSDSSRRLEDAIDSVVRQVGRKMVGDTRI